MKKFLTIVFILLLLSGCGDNTKDRENIDNIFKEEIRAVSKIGDSSEKILVERISTEEADKIFNELFDLAIFESSNVKYGEVTQGAGSDGKGGRVFCSKLPAEVEFTGSKESVHRFVKYFEEIENVVSFGEFKVDSLENEKYKVTTLVNFLGKAVGGSLSDGKKEYTIKRNEIVAEKEEEITLRDFDLSMTIRPSNSDSSSISLGVVSDKDYRVYSDANDKMEAKVTFSNEGNKYFCEYKIGEGAITKAEIKPSGNILFDILSCEIIEKDDNILVDLYISNNSNKKVSIFTYDDKDKRVNIAQKSGSIEVKNK